METSLVEMRQVELLYLIYFYAGGVGDSSYSLNLKDICTVDDGYALWFIAAEDLKHEGWIELSGKQLDEAVVSITPAGRKQAREWERKHDLDQRLCLMKPGDSKDQTNTGRYWVNFNPIPIGPAMKSGDEKCLDNPKAAYVVFDGTVKDALRYVTYHPGQSHDIYISDGEEDEREATVILSSERQREENQRLKAIDSQGAPPKNWFINSPKKVLSAGTIHLARINDRRTQVTFVALTEDCARYAESLIEKAENEGFIVLPQVATAAATGGAAEAIAVEHPSESEDKTKSKDLIVDWLSRGKSLIDICNYAGLTISYNTIRHYRDELIEENRLSQEFKKPRGKLGQNSI